MATKETSQKNSTKENNNQRSYRKEKKTYARTLYRHEGEPVIQMLNTVDHVVEII